MICKMIIAAATKYAISVALLSAVIHQESNFNPSAINSNAPVHSFGLGQLTIATALHRCKLPAKDIMNTSLNLDCAAKVLAYQYGRYNGDIAKALSAYNAGTFTPKNYEYVLLVKGRMKENYCGDT